VDRRCDAASDRGEGSYTGERSVGESRKRDIRWLWSSLHDDAAGHRGNDAITVRKLTDTRRSPGKHNIADGTRGKKEIAYGTGKRGRGLRESKEIAEHILIGKQIARKLDPRTVAAMPPREEEKVPTAPNDPAGKTESAPSIACGPVCTAMQPLSGATMVFPFGTAQMLGAIPVNTKSLMEPDAKRKFD
jgi:hypothetical protein